MTGPHIAPRRGLPQGEATSRDSVSVTTAATELVSAASPVGANRTRLVCVSTDADWYLGASNTVTATDGLLVEAKAWIELDGASSWYGICATGTADVRVYEVED